MLDTSAVVPRGPSPERLQELLSDPELSYERDLIQPGSSDSFLEKLMKGCQEEQQPPPLPTEEDIERARLIAEIIKWGLIGLGVLLLIIVLSRTQLRTLFYRRRPQSVEFRELNENIHAMDFAALIQEAVTAGMYRRAVRLLYLRTLKGMTDQELIDWRIDKTNRDYQRELYGSPLRDGFRRITFFFEYAWYGDLPVDGERYAEIRAVFDAFDRQLSAAEDSKGGRA